MGNSLSPLRYPGGKSKIYKRVKTLIDTNNLNDRIYIEPYAGGFGVGLSLLEDGVIHNAILNEYDTHVFNFWHTVFNHSEELITLINETEITMEERKKQKCIYSDKKASMIQDGFATLFLNRVNYSGVLFGGPIGGNKQTGAYLLDCRFNKKEIIKKIQIIAQQRDFVELYNCDAIELIQKNFNRNPAEVVYNIDPPYVVKGKSLYSKYYTVNDHIKLRDAIESNLADCPWIVTYDNCDLVKDLYSAYHIKEYDMYHSAHNRVVGKELVITNIPEESFVW